VTDKDKEMTKPIVIKVPMSPMSMNSAYGTGKHQNRRFLLSKGKTYKYNIQQACPKMTPLKGKIEALFRFTFPTKRRCDTSNFVKLAEDALTGYVYEDDSQIYVHHLYKYYDKNNPSVEIVIKEIEDDE